MAQEDVVRKCGLDKEGRVEGSIEHRWEVPCTSEGSQSLCGVQGLWWETQWGSLEGDLGCIQER